MRTKKIMSENLAKLKRCENVQKCYRSECEYMIEKNQICAIPYKWTEEYTEKEIKVFHDKEKKMPFVMVEDKKLYFPKKFSHKYIKKYFLSLLVEQDARSPHYYFDIRNEKIENAIWCDVGAAEGYISLRVIEKVKKVYLFECDNDWIDALKATFEPWKDKVEIVNKYASNEESDKFVRLDSIKFADTDLIILKLDVEGMEKQVLDGASDILNREMVQVYCCTYHKKDDERELGQYLVNLGFDIEKSINYMFYGGKDASFRRGIIRARK